MEDEDGGQKYAATLIKINDEYAFYVVMDEYDGTYRMIGPDAQYATKKEWVEGGMRRRGYSRDTSNLKPMDIPDYINFDDNKVDIILVTVDKKRMAMKRERSAGKSGGDTDINANKKKALKKFLDKKSGGLINDISKKAHDEIDKLNEILKKNLEGAISGKYPSGESYKKQITNVEKLMSDVNSLSHYIAGIMKEGRIKEKAWRTQELEDSFDYRRFKEFIKKFHEEADK